MHGPTALWLGLTLGLGLGAANAGAQCAYVETAQFFGPQDDHYGVAASIELDVAVVGAPWTDVEGELDQGAAYVYRRVDGTWVFDVELTPADGSYLDMFGDDVRVADGRLFISNSGWDKPSAGGVYIYQLSELGEWVQADKIDCPPGEDWFASAMSVQGGLLAVQAGQEAGSVYLYRHTDAGLWEEEDRLTMPGDDGLNYFGYSLSISGDAIAVGMANWYEPVDGRAFVFARGQDGKWSEQAQIEPPPNDAGFCYTTKVWLSGSSLFVQATYGDGGPFGVDVLYGYTRDLDGVWNLTGSFPGFMSDLSGDLAIIDEDLYQRRPGGDWQAVLTLPLSGGSLTGSRVIIGDRFGFPDANVRLFDLLDCQPCEADLNGDGALDLWDFLHFVNLFNAGDPLADCDQSGGHDLFDFLCFVSLFNEGC
jgi:hypothetical protein